MRTRNALKIILLLCFSWSSVKAGAIDRFFQSLGGQTNHSTPGAFHDQAAGYYTGGGYVMRQNNPVVNPINVSLPKLGVGCNGLDMYFGSLSFLKAEKLVELGRAAITGIPTYGLQLALKTMSPEIETLLAQLRKYVQDMNGLMLNSCQASQQIVGGLLPKGTAAHEIACREMNQNTNTDWFGARSRCDKPEAINAKVEEAKAKYKDLLMGEYNLVWHVLQKMPEYAGADKREIASFIMSVTGTLISKKDGDNFRVRTIEPKADQQEFIGAYLKGGTTSKLVCNEGEKCLAPTFTAVTIEEENTMKNKISRRINDLRNKYIAKGDLTDEDRSFLNDSVSLPVYRYIQVSVSVGTSFLMQDAEEFIAVSVLLSQFDRVMSEVLEAVDLLQNIQLDDTSIAKFKRNLQEARSRVQALLTRANNGSIYQLTQTIRSFEQAIIAKNS